MAAYAPIMAVTTPTTSLDIETLEAKISHAIAQASQPPRLPSMRSSSSRAPTGSARSLTVTSPVAAAAATVPASVDEDEDVEEAPPAVEPPPHDLAPPPDAMQPATGGPPTPTAADKGVMDTAAASPRSVSAPAAAEPAAVPPAAAALTPSSGGAPTPTAAGDGGGSGTPHSNRDADVAGDDDFEDDDAMAGVMTGGRGAISTTVITPAHDDGLAPPAVTTPTAASTNGSTAQFNLPISPSPGASTVPPPPQPAVAPLPPPAATARSHRAATTTPLRIPSVRSMTAGSFTPSRNHPGAEAAVSPSSTAGSRPGAAPQTPGGGATVAVAPAATPARSVASSRHSITRPSTASATGGTGTPRGMAAARPPAAATTPRATTPSSTTRGRTGPVVRPPAPPPATTGGATGRSVSRGSAALTPARRPAQPIATPTSASRGGGEHAHVASRFRQAAAEATQRSRAELAGARRTTSVPPPSRYTPGVGHSRPWVDVTNQADVTAAAAADVIAVAEGLGLLAPGASGDGGGTQPARRLSATSLPPAVLAAALNATTPGVALSPSRAVSRGGANTALFGKGSASRHPMRRSSKAAELEDEIEVARAEALGLVVGTRGGPRTPGQVAATTNRLYSAAAEQRAKAAMAATVALSEHSFSPAITPKAAAMGHRITYATANLDPATMAAASPHPRPRANSASAGGGASSSAMPRYLLLHHNAAAIAAARATAVSRASRDDQECTFTPWITNKARTLAAARRGEDASPASDRLYAHARAAEEKKAIAAAEYLKATAPFVPALNPTSRRLMEGHNRAAELALLPESTSPTALAMRKLELELAPCTFTPAINERSRRSRSATVDGGGRVQDRLLARGKQAEEKRATAQAEAVQRELAAATFHPTIDAQSQRIMEGKGRSVSRGSGRGPAPLPAAVAAGTVARLYGDAEAIRARLDDKRRQLEAASKAVHTHKPTIDHNSRIMTMTRRMGSPMGGGAGGHLSLIPSMGHPQKAIFGSPSSVGGVAAGGTVWDRLYSDAKDFEDARARAIAAAVQAELAQVTFQPAISAKSRRIATIADNVLSSLATMRPAPQSDAVGEGDATAGGGSGRKAAVWDRLYAAAMSEPEIRALRLEMARRIELRDCTFKPRTLFSPPPPLAVDAPASAAVVVGGGGVGGGTGDRPATSRNVWAELSNHHKDVVKLDEIKARMELATCTFTPNVAQPVVTGSGSGSRASSPRLDLSRATSTASFRRGGGDGSLSARSARAGGGGDVRPVDVWERIVSEVEAEAAAGGVKHLTSHDVEKSLSRGRSASPAIFERLYQEGVGKMGPMADASREEERRRRELEGCTFTPTTSPTPAIHAASSSGGEPAVYERLYRQAEAHEAAVAATQAEAEESVKALSQVAVDPTARDAMLAAEAAALKHSRSGIPATQSSLSLASAMAAASSLGLHGHTSSRLSMGGGAGSHRRISTEAEEGAGHAAHRLTPTLYSPAGAVGHEDSMTFGDGGGEGGIAPPPQEAPIAVKLVQVVADGVATGAPHAADAPSAEAGEPDGGGEDVGEVVAEGATP